MPDSKPPNTDSPEVKNPSRRNILFVGGAALAAAGAWCGGPVVQRLIPRQFAFEPYEHIKGFRRFSAGQVSGGTEVLVGLNGNGKQLSSRAGQAVHADICTALFGPEPVPAGVVPVASFSDYNCPYCRVLSDILLSIEEQFNTRIRVTWHEWPTLGRSSKRMAQAALAARRQGAYQDFHRSLMRSRFVPTIDYLRELAKHKGIEPSLMLADMKSPEIAWEIARSTALAQTFGFRGTPALVVGRTAVVGAVSRPALQALIELERKAGPVPSCA